MNRLKNLIKNNIVIQKLYIIFGTAFFRFIGLFIPIKKNRILFTAMSGNSYEYTSPYVLYLAIKEKYGDSYEYVWAFSKKQKAENYNGKRVKIDSFRYFINVLKSRIWITDVNIERGLRLKRKKQYYVNTWHGGITKGYPKKRKDYKLTNVDIFCSDGEEYEKFFIEHYKVNPNAFLRCGRPREDDIFYHQEHRDEYREKHGFSKNDYIVLYMPTWRENGNDNCLDFNVILEKLPDIKILFHAHNLSNDQKLSRKNIFDLSNESNVNMLYAIANLLITDFSSCMYDFMLLDKPVILFAKDYNDYLHSRGLALDFKQLFPNSMVTEEVDLVSVINKIRNNYNVEEYREFLKRVVSIDRKCSATKIIISKMEEDGCFIY